MLLPMVSLNGCLLPTATERNPAIPTSTLSGSHACGPAGEADTLADADADTLADAETLAVVAGVETEGVTLGTATTPSDLGNSEAMNQMRSTAARTTAPRRIQ